MGLLEACTCAVHVKKFRPWTPVADENAGPQYSVEVNVVLAHELVELDIVVVEPPFAPARIERCRDAGISERSVELNNVSEFNIRGFC